MGLAWGAEAPSVQGGQKDKQRLLKSSLKAQQQRTGKVRRPGASENPVCQGGLPGGDPIGAWGSDVIKVCRRQTIIPVPRNILLKSKRLETATTAFFEHLPVRS